MSLSDEMTFEVSQMCYNQFYSQKQEQKLKEEDIEAFKKNNIKPLYPHESYFEDEDGQKVKKIRKHSCTNFCCHFTPGRFFCCQSTPPDKVYRNFGLGACLYFKFLKHIACFLVFASIFSTISVLLYFMVAANSGIDISEGYKNFIFAGTIGTLSSQSIRCQYSTIVNNSASFSLRCHSGSIAQGWFVYSEQTLNSLRNCRVEFDKIEHNDTNPDYSIKSYKLEQYCTETTCDMQVIINEQTDEKYMSYTYQCLDSDYDFGGTTFDQQTIIYITVTIDLTIILFFLVFLASEYYAEKSQIQYFKGIELSLNDFSIKIDGFDHLEFDREFEDFVEEINKKVSGGELESKIVKVKIPVTKQVGQGIKRRHEAYQELFDLIQQHFFDLKINLNRYHDNEQFIKDCYETADNPSYIHYKEKLSDALRKYKKSKQIPARPNQKKETHAYIVMVNPKYKRQLFELSTHKYFSRYLEAGDKLYKISEPPVPDMIIWENKYKWTCLRVLFIWLITLLICFGSYLLVGLAEYRKLELEKQHNFNVDCDLLFTNSLYDSYSTHDEPEYQHCYCFHHYTNFNLTDDVEEHCDGWFSDYMFYLGIPILISFGIVLYNLLISRFFKVMTKFQAHEELTSELYSYIIKRTFVLVMNMGLVVIFLKLKYNDGESLLSSFQFLLHQATYEDITPDWYLEIGVLITLTLGVNILIPILEMLLMAFLRFLRRAWDQRCGCRATSQKTLQGYLDLYTNDVYPIEERYADLLAIIIITLSFSAVIPGLYIIALFSILFMIICDKVVLFRVYQRPANYTCKLQEKVFNTVFLSLIIHCVSSALMLSEPSLIAAGTTISKIEETLEDFSNQRIKYMFITGYIVPYVILFFLLAIWAFFNATIISLIFYCLRKCKQHEMSLVTVDKLNRNFFDSLNQYQTTRLKMTLERERCNKYNHTIVTQTNYKKVSVTNEHYMKSTMKSSLREKIINQSIKKLEKRENIDFNLIDQSKTLIGKASYQEIFDDKSFKRERKIRILDRNIKDLLRKHDQKFRNKDIINLHLPQNQGNQSHHHL